MQVPLGMWGAWEPRGWWESVGANTEDDGSWRGRGGRAAGGPCPPTWRISPGRTAAASAPGALAHRRAGLGYTALARALGSRAGSGLSTRCVVGSFPRACSSLATDRCPRSQKVARRPRVRSSGPWLRGTLQGPAAAAGAVADPKSLCHLFASCPVTFKVRRVWDHPSAYGCSAVHGARGPGWPPGKDPVLGAASRTVRQGCRLSRSKSRDST